jgi:hypothetical protein
MPATYWFIMFVFFGSAGICIYIKSWVSLGLFLFLGFLFTNTYLKARERIRSSAVRNNLLLNVFELCIHNFILCHF